MLASVSYFTYASSYTLDMAAVVFDDVDVDIAAAEPNQDIPEFESQCRRLRFSVSSQTFFVEKHLQSFKSFGMCCVQARLHGIDVRSQSIHPKSASASGQPTRCSRLILLLSNLLFD